MKNTNRSGAVQLLHDEKMRLDLSSRPRRGHSEVCTILYLCYKIA
ncbi:hypothetical protein [Treponema sp. R8-4-B8]